MSWFGPVFWLIRRELALLPRQTWYYRRRITLVAAGLALLAMGLVVLSGKVAAPGVVLFRYLTVSLLIAALLQAMATSASLLIRQRENRTLDLILLSEVGWGQYLVAKQLFATASVLLGMAAALPIVGICVGLGGIAREAVGWTLAIVIGMVWLGSAAGVCIAAVARTPVEVRIYSALMGALLLVIAPGAVVTLATLSEVDLAKVMVVVSPVKAALAAIAGEHAGLWGIHLAVMLGSGCLLSLMAALLLPASLSSPRLPGFMDRLSRDLRDTQTIRTLTRRPAILGNPVTWMQLHTVFGGYRVGWAKLILFTGFLVVIVVGMGSVLAMPLAETWRAVWRVLILFYATVFVGGTISRCCTAFERERRNGALDILLTSDLSNEEILLGKAWGILHGYSPYAIGLLGCALAPLLVYDHPIDQINSLFSILDVVAAWFACCSIAFYLAVKANGHRNVIAVCLFYMLCWCVIAVLFPQHGVVAHLLFVLIAATWHGYIGLLCWRFLAHHCRELLLGLPPAPPGID